MPITKLISVLRRCWIIKKKNFIYLQKWSFSQNVFHNIGTTKPIIIFIIIHTVRNNILFWRNTKLTVQP